MNTGELLDALHQVIAENDAVLREAVVSLGAEYVGEIIGRVLEVEKPKPPSRKDRIPNGLRRRVYERDRYRCVRCGTYKNLSVDHVHPESRGGKTVSENLQTMCVSCNSSKGNRIPVLKR